MGSPLQIVATQWWSGDPLPRRRQLLWLKEGKKCHWCKQPTRLVGDQSWDMATIEHVIPRNKGGTNDEENLVSACHRCNNRRAHEDQLGLPDGALLGQYKEAGGGKVSVPREFRPKPGSLGRVVLTGDEKRAVLERLAKPPVHMKADEVLREQRDQGLATIERLRAELAHSELRRKDLARALQNMTVLGLMRRRIVKWLEKGINDGA